MSETYSSQSPRMVSSTLSLSAYSAVNLVLGLAGTVIITHHFSTQDFGIYALILVVVSFLNQISTFGLDMSVARFVAGAQDELTKERFVGTAVAVRILAIALASLFAWFGGPWLRLLFGQSLLPGVLVYVPLIFALMSLQNLLKSIMQGFFLFTKIGITDLIANVLNIIFIAGIIFGLNGNVIHLILAKAASSFFAIMFAFASIPVRRKITFYWDTFKELMKFGFPLQINDFLSFIFLRVDSVVVAAFLGPVDVAIYEVARKIPDYLRNIYEPFRAVYYPFVSKKYAIEGKEQTSRFTNEAMRFIGFLTLFGTVIVVLFGNDIIRMLFSAKYMESTPIFIMLMINLSIALVGNVMGTTLVAVGETQKPPIINSVNAIASWLGSILLVPLYSLLGAAGGNTIGTAIAYPLNMLFLHAKVKIEYLKQLKPLALFGIWWFAVYLIKPVSFGSRISFLFLFLLGSVFLSIVTKGDIELFLKESGIRSSKPYRRLEMWISKL